MADYDAIVVGAGHNGLAAAIILAKEGLKVLDLEKRSHVGGMAGTQEFFPGFKHNVGAWALMFFSQHLMKALELERHGLEIIEPPTSYCTFGAPGQMPLIFYSDAAKMEEHLRKDHGPDALESMNALIDYCNIFRAATARAAFRAPRSVGDLIDSVPSLEAKDAMRRFFFGSCMDLVREFFPDPEKHQAIQGSLAGMAADGSGMGPYTPGSALSLVYHLAPHGLAHMFRLTKGGMGMLSEAMKRSLEEKGGEVRLRTPVKKILVENGRAVGVQLVNGENISGRVILSNADAYATFVGLVGEDNLPSDFIGRVKRINYMNPYIQIQVTLRELPEFTGHLAFANESNLRWNMAYYPSPEHLEQCWESCKWGRIPEDPLVSYYIPSIFDDSLAPPGYHTATFFSQYYPVTAPRDQHKRLKEEMADKMIGQMCRYAPNLKEAIVDRAVFTPLQYENMFGITGGDYSHGLMQPGQMFDFRPVVGWSNYRTPVAGLYLCGSACHPGPGVTALPGYNSAREVLKDWRK